MNVGINTATCLSVKDRILVVFMSVYATDAASMVDFMVETTNFSSNMGHGWF